MAKKAADKTRNVHAVLGGDSYLAEQALEQLLQQEVGGSDRAEAVRVMRGDEVSWARVTDAARTGSLFATRRAVVVRNADAIKGEGDELLAYLEDPTPDAALIVLATKPDKRRTPWRQLVDRAASVVP